MYSLTCKPGEKICYGAWRDYQTIYWGAGKGGRQACRNCCGTCGGRTVEVTLRHGGPDSFPRTSGGGGSTAASDGIDALTAIIGGFAQGYAAGSAYNRGGGGGSPAPVPRGVNRRQSDITR